MASTAFGNTGLGNPAWEFIRAPRYVNAYDFGASSANTIDIPSGAMFVEMKANLDLYVTWGSTGVSTASTNAGGASELLPAQSGGHHRRCIVSTVATTAISAMTTAAAHVTVAWWGL